MRTRQMLERVRAFGTTHRDLFLPQSGAGRMFAVVADVLESLRRHDVAAMEGRSSERAGVESKAAARIALRRRLSGISRTARVAAFDKPGFDKRFRVRLDCSDERLLANARTFVEAAGPRARTFIDHDMPSSFLSQLRTEIDTFEETIRARQQSRGRRAAARAGITTEIRRGLRAAKRLTAMVPNTVQDPAILAAWKAARRIGYPRRIKNSRAA